MQDIIYKFGFRNKEVVITEDPNEAQATAFSACKNLEYIKKKFSEFDTKKIKRRNGLRNA